MDVKLYPHRAAAEAWAAVTAWAAMARSIEMHGDASMMLGMGLGPILEHHHWLALAAAADARCGYTLTDSFVKLDDPLLHFTLFMFQSVNTQTRLLELRITSAEMSEVFTFEMKAKGTRTALILET